MVPNTVVLRAAVVPLREPAARRPPRAAAARRARRATSSRCSRTPSHTPVRGEPRIALEEIDADEVVVRDRPRRRSSDRDGPKLADEMLAAVAP